MLAQHKPPGAGHAGGAGPKTADHARDDKARSDQHDKGGDKDAPTDPAATLSPVSVQALPAEAISAAAFAVLPGPPIPTAPAAPNAAAASADNTSEAMDTSLSGATAPLSGAALPTGGELLPQTMQKSASAEERAPASFSLPVALPTPAPASPAGIPLPASPGSASLGLPGAAGQAALPGAGGAAPGQAQVSAAQKAAVGLAGASPAAGSDMSGTASVPGANEPGPAMPPATKLALHQYEQFNQTGLQNTGRPANNTSKEGGAPAVQTGSAAGKDAALFSSFPSLTLSPSPAEAGVRAGQEWAQGVKAEADGARDKPGAPGDGVSGSLLMPGTPGTGEAKTAAAPAAPMLPQERAALMQQASDSMQTLHAQVLGHGRGQMTLQLHPQDWGKLQVSVTMTPDTTGNGGTRVTAHLVADSASVKQALETGGLDLRRALREAGLHLDQMTVTVRPPAASSESQSMGGSFSGDPRRNASQDAQSWAAPGGLGNNTAGGGQPTFGGGGANTGTQNPEQRRTAFTASGLSDDHEEHARQAVPIRGMAGWLDTRA